MSDKFKDVRVGDKLIASYSTDWSNPHLTLVTVTKVYKLYFVAAFTNGNTQEYNFRGDVRGGSKDTWGVTRRQTLVQWSQKIVDDVREVHQRKQVAKAFTKYINDLKLNELGFSTLNDLFDAVRLVALKPLVAQDDPDSSGHTSHHFELPNDDNSNSG
jgi:hypothetical protein